MFSSFYSKVCSIVDRHIPIKQLSRKEIDLKSKPWIIPALKKSFQVKTIRIENSSSLNLHAFINTANSKFIETN